MLKDTVIGRLLLIALLLSCWQALAADPVVATHAETEVALYKDWGRKCETPANMEREICMIFQQINIKESGKPLLHATIGYPPQQPLPVMVLTLPLGVALMPGLEVNVDQKGEALRMAYGICLSDGCRSVLPLSDTLLTAMKAGKKFNITYANSQGKVLRLALSLNGFTAAVNTIQR